MPNGFCINPDNGLIVPVGNKADEEPDYFEPLKYPEIKRYLKVSKKLAADNLYELSEGKLDEYLDIFTQELNARERDKELEEAGSLDLLDRWDSMRPSFGSLNLVGQSRALFFIKMYEAENYYIMEEACSSEGHVSIKFLEGSLVNRFFFAAYPLKAFNLLVGRISIVEVERNGWID